MSIPFAAGGLYSTAEDLFLWHQALYRERLLPPALRDLLFKPNLGDYGYGWGILVPKLGAPNAGEPIYMHGGAIFGFQSLIERITRHKQLIVLLDNDRQPQAAGHCAGHPTRAGQDRLIVPQDDHPRFNTTCAKVWFASMARDAVC